MPLVMRSNGASENFLVEEHPPHLSHDRTIRLPRPIFNLEDIRCIVDNYIYTSTWCFEWNGQRRRTEWTQILAIVTSGRIFCSPFIL